MNLIIMVPNTKGQITTSTMHDNVKHGLKALKEDR